MRYCLGPSESYGNVYAALAFMPFGLFFDFMDGKVARWRGKSSLMGQELDSLADLVRPSVIASSLLSRSKRAPITTYDDDDDEQLFSSPNDLSPMSNNLARYPSVWRLRCVLLHLASVLLLIQCSSLFSFSAA